MFSLLQVIVLASTIFFPIIYCSKSYQIHAAFPASGQEALIAVFGYETEEEIPPITMYFEDGQDEVLEVDWSPTIGGDGFYFRRSLNGDEAAFRFLTAKNVTYRVEDYSTASWYVGKDGFLRPR